MCDRVCQIKGLYRSRNHSHASDDVFIACNITRNIIELSITLEEADRSVVSVVVPYNTNLSSFKATFTNSPKSTVKVGNTEQQDKVTVNNFSNPVIYTITPCSLSPRPSRSEATTSARRTATRGRGNSRRTRTSSTASWRRRSGFKIFYLTRERIKV